ncbi:uncharacterized protein MONBRDRAFT_29011 [Monosiga brevicollis MX1]|uniref:Palmitoyltransferase n=1 Tax=Monosiga brevicollis TaxID=81824 RepID=A9V9U6_MONBE|nr:uncharacterized protein MONBRDRAFT_29011 [Monosiga brevicollis MX1]EDQ85785.1 predicted protein [Monosiga brevicollis MX1]|eukprot:XP_001749500.1 hypothetical protein [Monosiga brevicollis MX1]
MGRARTGVCVPPLGTSFYAALNLVAIPMMGYHLDTTLEYVLVAALGTIVLTLFLCNWMDPGVILPGSPAAAPMPPPAPEQLAPSAEPVARAPDDRGVPRASSHHLQQHAEQPNYGAVAIDMQNTEPRDVDPAVSQSTPSPISHSPPPPPSRRPGQTYKWCITCQLWRPSHASHCSHCGFCIEHYDHHCK